MCVFIISSRYYDPPPYCILTYHQHVLPKAFNDES